MFVCVAVFDAVGVGVLVKVGVSVAVLEAVGVEVGGGVLCVVCGEEC